MLRIDLLGFNEGVAVLGGGCAEASRLFVAQRAADAAEAASTTGELYEEWAGARFQCSR
jgi:hypothetical protein